jgi:ribonuclease D
MDSNIKYIDDQSSFQEALSKLELVKKLYIDLEFDKNHFRYGFNLCLMQVFDGEVCYLIDPLGNIKIESIFPILENPEIEKVCFAFGEDIRLLHHIGCRPKKVLDLAVVRTLLNKPTLSLSNSLVEALGLEAQSSQQKSNWFARPLSAEQIQYAAEDVLDLPKLRDVLMDELEKIGRTEWMEQEQKLFESEDWTVGAEPEIVPFKDRKQLTMHEWIRYSLIMEYRDYLSSNLNRPSYKVIDKNSFLDIAKNPEKIHNWKNLKGVHPKLRNDKVQTKLTELLEEAEITIKKDKVKEDQSSRPTITSEQKMRNDQLRKETEHAKNTIFLPIKELLKKDYGEHFSNYLLSNRKIVGIVSGNINLLEYQKKLLNHYKANLNISNSKYF